MPPQFSTIQSNPLPPPADATPYPPQGQQQGQQPYGAAPYGQPQYGAQPYGSRPYGGAQTPAPYPPGKLRITARGQHRELTSEGYFRL